MREDANLSEANGVNFIPSVSENFVARLTLKIFLTFYCVVVGGSLIVEEGKQLLRFFRIPELGECGRRVGCAQ